MRQVKIPKRLKVKEYLKFKEIKAKYGIHQSSDYQKAMWSLNDFVQTDSHSVWDQVQTQAQALPIVHTMMHKAIHRRHN